MYIPRAIENDESSIIAPGLQWATSLALMLVDLLLTGCFFNEKVVVTALSAVWEQAFQPRPACTAFLGAI